MANIFSWSTAQVSRSTALLLDAPCPAPLNKGIVDETKLKLRWCPIMHNFLNMPPGQHVPYFEGMKNLARFGMLNGWSC